MAIEPHYLLYRYYHYDVLLLGFTPLFPIHEMLHQMLKHSATLVQPVLELTGVRCPTIPPGRLHVISVDDFFPGFDVKVCCHTPCSCGYVCQPPQ